MSITFNNTNVNKIVYNDIDISKVIYNDTVVFTKREPTPDEYFTFTYQESGAWANSYLIKAKDVNNLPEHIVIPSTHEGKPVKVVDINGFSKSAIKSVYIPNSIRFLHAYAFFACAQLENVIFESNTYLYDGIGGGAFARCTSLKTFRGPSYCTAISGSGIWSVCDSLKTIWLPENNIYEIGELMFKASPMLESLIILRKEPPKLKARTFEDMAPTCSIYVPPESVELYKAAEYWSDRADYIKPYIDIENKPYTFNDTLDYTPIQINNIMFTDKNNINYYSSITRNYSDIEQINNMYYDSKNVYGYGTWYDKNKKTITITNSLLLSDTDRDTFTVWLTNNTNIM